jgi:amino acid adenylation domain-containing protein
LHPSKTAIAGTSWQPTFTQLDDAANRLAASLIDPQLGSGPAALLLRHDAPLIAAALGALKAGRIAVALNPGDPAARLARIRADVEPAVVLTDPDHHALALDAGFPPAAVRLIADRPDVAPHSPPQVALQPDDLAFLVYTSGSTGRPKGVMQTHRTLLHNVLRQTNGLGIHADDRVVLLASLSGGQGLATTWIALLNGATLCPFPITERGVTGLAGWLADHGITVFITSASVYRSFVRTLKDQHLRGVRVLRLGSELGVRADFDAYREHFSPSCLFVNTFSSSEAGNITQCLIPPNAEPPEGPLAIGHPAEGMQVLLRDNGRDVRPGQTGEIVVRSAYLSPGYWRNDELTASRFRGSEPERGFHTGDLGRLSDGGELTWLGRADTQVKVRGNRVELSEVELEVAGTPGVEAAVVCARSTPRGDTKLTAYVTASPGRAPTAAGLREALRATLPDHSVPAAFVFLPAFPLTPHGKVDREQLASIRPGEADGRSAQPPASETEEILAALWSEALECGPVGRDSDFFGLGGDSLTAAIVAAGVQEAFGIELELRAFAESPTVAAMARLVRSGAPTGEGPALVRVSRAAPLPLSFAQERIWTHSRTPEASAAWTMARATVLKGDLDPAALRRSVDHVVRRHEVLRTTFAESDGSAVQVIHPAEPVDMPLIDLSAEPDPEARVHELLGEQGKVPFALDKGPLLRLRLLRLGEREHVLLHLTHHIISDGWSWRVFFDELEALYEADRRGEPPPLAEELSLQYGDFAAWQRCWLSPDEARYREEVAWWREWLRSCPPELPLSFARRKARADAAASDGIIWWGLRPDLSRELDLLGKEAGATRFMVRLAAFSATLAHRTDCDDLVVGTYMTNRSMSELQAMFGFFSNLTTLRLRFDASLTLREWVERVRVVVLSTRGHADIPYTELCRELEVAGAPAPAIRVIFNVADHPPPRSFGGLELSPSRPRFSAMPWEFTFTVDQWYEASRCRATFDARKHDPRGVHTFIHDYRRLVEETCASPDRPLAELSGPRSRRFWPRRLSGASARPSP